MSETQIIAAVQEAKSALGRHLAAERIRASKRAAPPIGTPMRVVGFGGRHEGRVGEFVEERTDPVTHWRIRFTSQEVRGFDPVRLAVVNAPARPLAKKGKKPPRG